MTIDYVKHNWGKRGIQLAHEIYDVLKALMSSERLKCFDRKPLYSIPLKAPISPLHFSLQTNEQLFMLLAHLFDTPSACCHGNMQSGGFVWKWNKINN